MHLVKFKFVVIFSLQVPLIGFGQVRSVVLFFKILAITKKNEGGRARNPEENGFKKLKAFKKPK